jgi:DUF4097 and DUF4098 domain-containing protein YvlB
MKKRIFLKRLVPVAALTAAAATGCVFNATRVTTQKSGQVSSEGLMVASLDIQNYSGNITVTGTDDSVVAATATVSEIAIQGSSQLAADQFAVTVTSANGVGTVGFSIAGGGDQWELLKMEDVTLTSNRALDMWAATASGNINCTGIDGFVDLETNSGNITTDVVHGCYCAVTSGDINVTLRPDSTFGSATLQTTSGNIKVTVPAGFKANLSLSAKSGTIRTPHGDASNLNGGNSAAVITCSVTSGNITIEEE